MFIIVDVLTGIKCSLEAQLHKPTAKLVVSVTVITVLQYVVLIMHI